MTLLITIFLVLINIFNTIQTNSPQVAGFEESPYHCNLCQAEGLTAMEAWVIACIVFVFAALMEFVALFSCHSMSILSILAHICVISEISDCLWSGTLQFCSKWSWESCMGRSGRKTTTPWRTSPSWSSSPSSSSPSTSSTGPASTGREHSNYWSAFARKRLNTGRQIVLKDKALLEMRSRTNISINIWNFSSLNCQVWQAATICFAKDTKYLMQY